MKTDNWAKYTHAVCPSLIEAMAILNIAWENPQSILEDTHLGDTVGIWDCSDDQEKPLML